ncbi:MAG: glycine zipper domain-containing protein [Planctomycetota bacterium]
MTCRTHLTICSLAALLVAGPALAQQLMVFPNKGQSQEQQNKDRGECHAWAVNQTGYDPALASTTPPPSSQPTQGGVVRGGARGAATGAVVGAIAGDAGKGAAMGAAAGGLIGGMRRNDQRRQQQAEQQNWQAQQEAQRQNYRRGLSACLEGKGYTVK